MTREMKDSGIAWIGEIPASWKCVKLGFLYSFSSGDTLTAQDFVDNGEYKVFGANGERGHYDKYNVDGKHILIGRVGALCGNIHLINEAVWVTEHALVSYSFSPLINDEFSAYLLMAMNLGQYSSGTAQPVISADKIRRLSIPLPELEEQEKIVLLLDKECARIDAVIEQTRTSIEEYKKLKQAVITQAVTKGIRPNRPMKDSGIEWIGEIPVEWHCTKFKYIATVKSNLVQPDEYGDYLQVSPENIEKGSGKLLPCQTVSEVGVISGNHLFFKGQILYSKIRPKLNKVAIAPFDGLCSADMYPIETVLNTHYFVYALRSECFLTQVSLITEDRVKMPKINQDELGNTLFAIPPYNEQVEIAEYLDNKFIEIDRILGQKQQLLVDLSTYMKSMIYGYVTGKKEV